MGIVSFVVLLICHTCTITAVISFLSFGFFFAVCLWCICTVIASTFIYTSFSASMRAYMLFFPVTTISRIIAAYFHRLYRCSTISCLNSKSLHTSCILIGLQYPSGKWFPSIHIPNALLKNSSCGPDTAIDGPVPSRKYCGWPNILDDLVLMNLSTMTPLASSQA